MANITEGGTARAEKPAKTKGPLIYRQSIWTRMTHWVWVVCLFFLVASGLNIFNAHPTLYIGQQSGFPDLQSGDQHYDNAWLDIGAVNTDNGPRGQTTLLGHSFDTTGGLGLSGDPANPDFRGFPAAVTVPSYYDLATARVVHFFFAWILVATLAVWLIASIVNRHIAGIPPTPRDLGQLPRDVLNHLRLRFEHGRQYNVLQKIAYSVVFFVLFPLIILTGLTMSPGMDAAWPWLLEVFGGRQTARSIHFLTMSAFVLFFVIHIVMVILANPINELRQMITGRYRASADVPFDPSKGDRP
ncbi:MAG: cytochrome b/b6 domain-containing protein [Devosia sp.]|nr:cytochrome b/b6 domain-containing protein [Devosia sp.]